MRPMQTTKPPIQSTKPTSFQHVSRARQQAPVRRERPATPAAKHSRSRRQSEERSGWYFFSFIVLLSVVSVLFWFSPRQAIAQSEKRELQQLPALSWQSLADTSFSRDIERFYQDQFPQREQLLKIGHGLGYQLDSLLGAVAGEEEISIVHGKRQEMQNATPTSTAQGNTDEAALSTAPKTPQAKRRQDVPGAFMEKKPEGREVEGQIGFQNSSILVKGSQGMEIFYYSEATIQTYTELVKRLRQALPASIRMGTLMAPTAIAFYGPKDFQEGQNSEWDAIRAIYEALPPTIDKVDAYSELAKHSSEYIYFRTDHHWNGRGAYQGYVALCKSWGLTPSPLEGMQLTSPPGTFLGTLYSYSEQNPKLAAAPDQAEIFIPKHQGEIQYFSDFSLSDAAPGVLLNATFPQPYQYLLYIGGDVGIAKLTSDNKNGRKIALVKDSYANALAPYLLENYEEIYVIDPRVVQGDLAGFIQRQGIQDVLLVNYCFALGNPTFLEGFEANLPPAGGALPVETGTAPVASDPVAEAPSTDTGETAATEKP